MQATDKAVITGAEGRFLLSDLRANEKVPLSAWAPGFYNEGGETVRDGEQVRITLRRIPDPIRCHRIPVSLTMDRGIAWTFRIGNSRFALTKAGGRACDPDTLGSHRMQGVRDEKFMRDAIALEASATLEDGECKVTTTVYNRGAGHHCYAPSDNSPE